MNRWPFFFVSHVGRGMCVEQLPAAPGIHLSFMLICIAGSHDNNSFFNFAQESTELDFLQHDMDPCEGFRTCFTGVVTSFFGFLVRLNCALNSGVDYFSRP